MGEDVSCTSLSHEAVQNQITTDVLESRKRKNLVLDTSQRSSKHQKMCTSSTESLNEEDLSDARKYNCLLFDTD